MEKIVVFLVSCLLYSQLIIAQQHFLGCQHANKQIANLMVSDNSRSDTIDVLHYAINLDISDLSSRKIEGHCTIQVVAKVADIPNLLFDLEGLTVSQVKMNEQTATFTQVDNLIKITPTAAIVMGDTVQVQIFYGGEPMTASFGGFYFTNNYAYNLGVGIGVDPPNFGRAWFPCVDNFIERSTYSFQITTAANHKAFCNGNLLETNTLEDGRKVWHWKLNQTIPTYLASVAVADYVTLSYEHQGMNGPIPVQLGMRAGDSTNVKNSFVNLGKAIDGFEAAFGPYRFDRVGFVITPFTGGAMEHATNIAYPRFGVDGSLTYEDLMAHEFAHHWWGDLMTCQTADDMWLNEGWASFSANYFFEVAYDKERYKQEIRNNHESVLQFTHIRDQQAWAVADIPFDYTYGSTVYDKGADVIHALRAYMGEFFFPCLTSFLEEFAFKTATTEQLADFLSTCSGNDLTPFFDTWILQPGFPHFSIDSTKTTFDGSGSYQAEVFIRQKLFKATKFYEQVPLDITFFDFNMDRHTVTVKASGACSQHVITVPFFPIHVELDLEEKINDATTDNYKIIKETGTYEYPNTEALVKVQTITDSSLIRVTHHWVAPDRLDSPIENLILSPNRYWQISGFSTGSLVASAELIYDGSTSFNNGYLDNELITVSEQNLAVLFRPSSATDWQVLSNVTIEAGSNTDKRGKVLINQLQFGEYALGIYDGSREDTLTTYIPNNCALITGITENNISNNKALSFELVPNPATHMTKVKFEKGGKERIIQVYTVNGKLSQTLVANKQQTTLEINTKLLAKGVYIVKVFEKGQIIGSKKLLVP